MNWNQHLTQWQGQACRQCSPMLMDCPGDNEKLSRNWHSKIVCRQPFGVESFWRPEHTLVIELSPRLTPEEMLSSKQRVEELVTARFGR